MRLPSPPPFFSAIRGRVLFRPPALYHPAHELVQGESDPLRLQEPSLRLHRQRETLLQTWTTQRLDHHLKKIHRDIYFPPKKFKYSPPPPTRIFSIYFTGFLSYMWMVGEKCGILMMFLGEIGKTLSFFPFFPAFFFFSFFHFPSSHWKIYIPVLSYLYYITIRRNIWISRFPLTYTFRQAFAFILFLLFIYPYFAYFALESTLVLNFEYGITFSWKI